MQKHFFFSKMARARQFTSSFTLLTVLLVLLAACSQAPGPEDYPNPVASVWTAADVGGTGLGSAVIADQEVTVTGSGDIADTTDAFHFVYQTLNGDGSITAQLTEHDGVSDHDDSWPKAGITIRSSLEPDAANVTLFLVNNSSFTGAVVQERTSSGAQTTAVETENGTVAPHWLRLARNGNQISAETSMDGKTWSTITTVTPELDATAHLGLAAVSGEHTDATIEANYQNITVTDQNDVILTPQPEPEPELELNLGDKNSTTYQIDQFGIFLNPERGFHSDVNLLAGTGFSNARSAGYTLARSYVRLDDYRHQALPATLLSQIRRGLDQARASGIKLVLRFSYNFGYEADAPLNMVLTHIDQLSPIFHEYADVITTLQAGFIGAWGEWHSSTNGLTSTENKRIIGNALLDAVPDSRMVQVRTPGQARDVVGSPSPTVKMFSSEPQARLGFKNDCFVSSSNDAGTYINDEARDRAEAAARAIYTVTGGETCQIAYPSPRNSCAVALDELSQYHWDYLNDDFHSGVLNRWRSEGCYDEVSRRLGYRLALESSAVTGSAMPGGSLTLDLRMRNDGFGKVYNPRPLDIVFTNANTGATQTVRAVNDARTILPLAGEVKNLQLTVTLPANMPSGSYNLALALPDADPALAQDSRYSIRLANVGTWQADSGMNDLQLATRIGN